MAFASVSGFVRRLCVSMCFPYFAKTGDFILAVVLGFFLRFYCKVCVIFITLIKGTYQSIKNLSCGVLSIGNPTFLFDLTSLCLI
jgi:hypothetical protein